MYIKIPVVGSFGVCFAVWVWYFRVFIFSIVEIGYELAS